METVLSRSKKTETIGAIAIVRIEHCYPEDRCHCVRLNEIIWRHSKAIESD